MKIELCDICKQPLITFFDNGEEFEPIQMKQRTAKKLVPSFWMWENMSICGQCRAMLARKRKDYDRERREEQENESSD